ncbi:hypothetical protein HZS_7384 [Henneguya salminicola]|nr:hypothetical protein HZS_7384 [Henneguya salminicola]
MDEKRTIFFNEKLYQVNKSTDAGIYYRCSKFASGCGARLIKKGSHICAQNDSNQLETKKAISNAESFTNSFICEKFSRFELCPHQIYESLLLTLRQQFADMVYDIPSKKYINARINEIRGSMPVNNIYAITLEPMRSLQNASPFFRRYGTFIDGTFRSTPSLFKQCVIIMTFNRGTVKYIPCCDAILKGKSEQLYCNLFHELM